MKDLDQAIARLAEQEYTCVLCRGDVCYTANERGVKPLLDWLEEGVDLRGFAAADKVVGRGAAFLYVLLGVSAVWGRVMSEPARAVLQQHGIEMAAQQVVPVLSARL